MGARGPSALDVPTRERPRIVSTPAGQVLTYTLIPIAATTLFFVGFVALAMIDMSV